MKNNIQQKWEIIIYQISKKEVGLKVRFKNESVWLRQNQIAELFGKERTVITKHINKIFKDGEVNKKSNVHFLHIANSDKLVAFYSLDVILAIGYRTNSAKAVNFRKWATKVLKNYLIQGYAINQKRLLETQNKFNELQTVISFLKKQAGKKQLKGNEKEILNLLADYSKTLNILEKYDKDNLQKPKGKKDSFILEYQNCLDIIFELRKNLVDKKEASDFFGAEINSAFESIVKNLYQTFSGKELYKSLDEKAAHFLYLTIKDHPFSDGNKRIASFLFVYFLDKSNYLYRKIGEKKINDNALVALALLIAESNPAEKDTMIKIIMNLIFD